MTSNIVKIKFGLASLFFLAVIFSCGTKTEYDLLTGKLIGYVLLSSNNSVFVTDYSSVKITIEGSKPQAEAYCDTNGKYVIDNLKSGTYNILFDKDGYCQYKILGYQFVGGGQPSTPGRVTLYARESVKIDSLTITSINNYYSIDLLITAKFTLPDSGAANFIRYYMGDSPAVSYKNYVSTDVFGYPHYPDKLDLYLRLDTLQFPVGSTLYMIMYPATETYQSYPDLKTGNNIYSTVNSDEPSNVASFIVPEVLYSSAHKSQ